MLFNLPYVYTLSTRPYTIFFIVLKIETYHSKAFEWNHKYSWYEVLYEVDGYVLHGSLDGQVLDNRTTQSQEGKK